jgi:hypothetical protein
MLNAHPGPPRTERTGRRTRHTFISPQIRPVYCNCRLTGRPLFLLPNHTFLRVPKPLNESRRRTVYGVRTCLGVNEKDGHALRVIIESGGGHAIELIPDYVYP